MTIDAQAQQVLDQIAAQGAQPPDSPPSEAEFVRAIRDTMAGAAAIAGSPEPVARVAEEMVAGPGGPIRVRLYLPERPRATLLWLHGGSFVAGSLATHDVPLRAIANRANAAVIAVDWRLAPEHPFPAGLDDALTVLRWAAGEGAVAFALNPHALMIGGDSAGGALAAALALRVRGEGGPAIAGLVLIYPNADLRAGPPRYRSWAEHDGKVLSRGSMERCIALYAGPAGRNDPLLSPVLGTFAGLPRALIITGEADPLRDEGEALADRLAEAGVRVHHARYPGMIHGFLQMGGAIGATEHLYDEIGAWVRDGPRPRRIVVFGATGPTGREIVREALARGHHVTAFVHSAESEGEDFDPAVTRIIGDVLDPPSVACAVAGADAVLSALGSRPSPLKEVTLLSEGTRNMIGAMRTEGISRLIAITGIGAGDSRGHGGFVYDHLVQPTLLATVYDDKDRQEVLIRDSELDWTIVRPAMLTNDPGRRAYRAIVDLDGVTAGKIARADVAHFMLNELESGLFSRQTPLITD